MANLEWEAIWGGAVRHVLTFLGGFLVTKGTLDSETLMQVVGAIGTIGGFAWSAVKKKAS